jgi:hypothetical protein
MTTSALGWLATAVVAVSYLAKRSRTLRKNPGVCSVPLDHLRDSDWRSSSDCRKRHRGGCRAILVVPAHTRGSRTSDLLGKAVISGDAPKINR